jgi:thiol-disulfide isomerase/thioredoxin
LITADSVERRYTGKEIYITNHQARTVEIFKGDKDEWFGITGNIVDQLLAYSFLKKNAFSMLAAAPNVVSHIGQATVDGRTCEVVSIRLPDDDETTENVRTYWIDTLTNVPVKFTSTVHMGKQVEYEELLLSDVVLDGVKRSDLAEYVIPAGYSTSHYHPPDYTLLSNGTRAPAFAGRNYPSEEETQIADYAGRVIVLDFWFMSCGPCQKSIPGLTAFQEKYGGRGLVVIGVDWPDADSTGRMKLRTFVKEKDLRYTILLAARAVADTYNVKVYPTLYLIDRQGTIRFSQLGFNAGEDDTLTAVIERELDRDH